MWNPSSGIGSQKQKDSFLPSHISSDYVVEVSYDHEAGFWFYAVDALNIIGTGCLSREEAERYAQESIAFALEEFEDPPLANR